MTATAVCLAMPHAAGVVGIVFALTAAILVGGGWRGFPVF